MNYPKCKYSHVSLHLFVGSDEPLVELLGLPGEAGEEDEGGDEEDNGPHAQHHHRHIPHLILGPAVVEA